MVCSRSGVYLYVATPRSGPGLQCGAARFVSAMYATVWVLSLICRPQEEPLSAGRVRVHTCCECYNKRGYIRTWYPVSYTHLRAHETRHDLVCRLLLEKKKLVYVPGTCISPFVVALAAGVNSNPSSRERFFLRTANPRQDPNSCIHG